MRTLLSLFLLLSACNSVPATETHSQTITGGQLAPDGAHPETVFLALGNSMCTGTLVAQRVVLTARHCMQGVSDVQAYFGNDPSEGSGTWLRVVDTLLHPTADIAMLALESSAPVQPVPIHVSLGERHVGQGVTIVGFGETQGAGPAAIKREGLTSIAWFDRDLMIVGQDGADTCFGDSGGPTFLDEGGIRYVAAVTSFGDSEDCRLGLSYNVRTDSYAEWITNYIVANSCGDADGMCINDCGKPDPDCALVGEFCSADDQCSDNLCAWVDELSLCTQTCVEDTECPQGFECLDGVACWPQGEESGGCSTGSGGQGLPLVVLLAGALLWRRRLE